MMAATAAMPVTAAPGARDSVPPGGSAAAAAAAGAGRRAYFEIRVGAAAAAAAPNAATARAGLTGRDSERPGYLSEPLPFAVIMVMITVP